MCTNEGKSVDTSGKSALCEWIKIQFCKVAKMYRSLYGGGQVCIHLESIQMSHLKLCDFWELYRHKFLTNQFQTWQCYSFKGVLSSGVGRFSPNLSKKKVEKTVVARSIQKITLYKFQFFCHWWGLKFPSDDWLNISHDQYSHTA